MLVVHDPLCPLTPAAFIEEAMAECAESGAVVVGVRPVTDTVKEYDAQTDRVGPTADRDELMCGHVAGRAAAAVVAALEELRLDDFAGLVGPSLPSGSRCATSGASAGPAGLDEDLTLEALSRAARLDPSEQRLGERDVLGKGHLQVGRGAGHADHDRSA